jgi:hypothetical protein
MAKREERMWDEEDGCTREGGVYFREEHVAYLGGWLITECHAISAVGLVSVPVAIPSIAPLSIPPATGNSFSPALSLLFNFAYLVVNFIVFLSNFIIFLSNFFSHISQKERKNWHSLGLFGSTSIFVPTGSFIGAFFT